MISMEKTWLCRAPLVIPVSTPPIENGAVLVHGDKIAAVGHFSHLKGVVPPGTNVLDIEEGLIMPGLVNCHSHLTLSWMKDKIERGLGFSRWLRQLMGLNATASQEQYVEALQFGMGLSKKAGTVLLGDVLNSPVFSPSMESTVREDSMFIHFFLEVIHPKALWFDTNDMVRCLEEFFISWSLSAHSVYTCSRQALCAIKAFCQERGLTFSIHVAESREELEFVTRGKGPIAEILREKNRDVDGFFRSSPSPVRLLDEEGLLDEKTMCVHCTFLDDTDLDILGSRGAWVCLCPESNLYISGSMPRIDKIVQKVERICFGTDSLASNSNLSILSQLRAAFRAYPSIEPAILFKAATLGGAKALGFERFFGSLTEGATARFLILRYMPCKAHEVFEFLCSESVEERIEQFEP